MSLDPKLSKNLCRRFRTKGMFVDVEPDPTVPSMSSECFWCTHTMNALGQMVGRRMIWTVKRAVAVTNRSETGETIRKYSNRTAALPRILGFELYCVVLIA